MIQFNKFKGTKGFVSTWQRVIRWRYMITETAKQRTRILAFWEKYREQAAKEAFGVSRRTLFRWQKTLQEGSGRLESLNPGSRAPRNKRKRVVDGELGQRIVGIRTLYPRLGKDKVWYILQKKGYQGSISTVGRIIADFKKAGKLPGYNLVTVSGKTGRMVARKPKKQRKKLRRPKGYRVLEVDTVVRFIDGAKRYILTAIDTEKRTAFAAAYTNHGSTSAADFLSKTRSVLPDCPDAIQTDNGSEFSLHFETAIKRLNLVHFHTYPYSPKQNAHVERFNRTLNEEFLRSHRSLMRDDVRRFNEKLVDWLLWYNGERPHYALGLNSPFQAMIATLPAKECHMWWTDTFYCG